MKRRKAQIPSLDSSHDAVSSSSDGSSSSSISSARERRVGKNFRAPNFARDLDFDCDRTAACSDARRSPADSCGQATSSDVVISAVLQKFPSRVCGVEQRMGAPSDARGCDRDSTSLGRSRRAPGISMSSCSRQLLGSVRKPSLTQQKRSLRSVLDDSKCPPM